MKYYIGAMGKQEYLKDPSGTPIIVDVLRASSTIIAALWTGAEKVIPVEDADQALKLGREMGAVLIGERHGVKMGGFDYNNSPSEILEADLKGKTVVITTSNGTRIMMEGGVIGSTLNAGAVADYVRSLDRSYLLATGPDQSEEDLCAAELIEIIVLMLNNWRTLSSALQLIAMDPDCQQLLDGIRCSASGKKLSELGYQKDIELICNAINDYPIVPVYRDGCIKALTF